MYSQLIRKYQRQGNYVKPILLVHTLLSLAAVSAITVLAILKDVTPTTAVIVILAATGIGQSGNSAIQALLNTQTRVEVPKNGEPTIVKSGGGN